MYVLLWMPLNIFFKDISCWNWYLDYNPWDTQSWDNVASTPMQRYDKTLYKLYVPDGLHLKQTLSEIA